MKKFFNFKILILVCITFYICLIVFAWNPVITVSDPSGYKIYSPKEDSIVDPYIIVNCDEVLRNWNETMESDEYLELESIMQIDSWIKINDDFAKNPNHSNIRIHIYEPIKNSNDQMRKNIYLFSNDSAIISESKDENEPHIFYESYYQLPNGLYYNIQTYLHNYYENKCKVYSDLESLISEILNGDYYVSWIHTYDNALEREGIEITSDHMVCLRNDSLTKDLSQVFSDCPYWEKINVNLNVRSIESGHNNSVCIVGTYRNKEIIIQIDEIGANSSRVLVGQYNMYLVPYNLLEKILCILDSYEDLWMVNIIRE